MLHALSSRDLVVLICLAFERDLPQQSACIHAQEGAGAGDLVTIRAATMGGMKTAACGTLQKISLARMTNVTRN